VYSSGTSAWALEWWIGGGGGGGGVELHSVPHCATQVSPWICYLIKQYFTMDIYIFAEIIY
jgi:hypothetical protein